MTNIEIRSKIYDALRMWFDTHYYKTLEREQFYTIVKHCAKEHYRELEKMTHNKPYANKS